MKPDDRKVISGSAVLSLYGLRDCRDIDLIYDTNKPPKDSHNQYIVNFGGRGASTYYGKLTLDDIMNDALCGVALIENVTGMQNKVLDYLFYGIPALVSQDVYDGLPDGSPLMIIRNRDELRDALAKCLSIENRRSLQVRGYKYLDKLNKV